MKLESFLFYASWLHSIRCISKKLTPDLIFWAFLNKNYLVYVFRIFYNMFNSHNEQKQTF